MSSRQRARMAAESAREAIEGGNAQSPEYDNALDGNFRDAIHALIGAVELLCIECERLENTINANARPRPNRR